MGVTKQLAHLGDSMKVILIALAGAILFMTAAMWVVFVMHDEPQQNQMIDGCVYQKSQDRWIKTCG